MKAVIPPKKSRTAQRFYAKELHKLRISPRIISCTSRGGAELPQDMPEHRLFPHCGANQMHRSLEKFLLDYPIEAVYREIIA